MSDKTHIRENAERIADLTFTLLVLCQEKEVAMAEEFGLSQSEFRTIRLFRGEHHISQKTLNKRLGLSGSRLTRILDQLQEQGYIARNEDPRDRREYVISLTPHGLELAKELEKRHVQIHEEILNEIPPSMHTSLGDSLQQMVVTVGGWISKRRHKEQVQ